MTAEHVTADGPLAAYHALLMQDGLAFDPVQEAAATRLQALHDALSALSAAPAKRGGLRLFGRRAAIESPRGVYLWGSVGRGKTMLMDLFFAGAPIGEKRRVHYHRFMQELHRELNTGRVSGDASVDPLAPIVDRLAAEARLLCFDEFHVTDIGDAMILGRLFKGLFEAGVVPVVTSNRAPDGLYEGGVNRDRFLPFIDIVKARMDVVELGGEMDYRQLYLREARLYHTPLSAEADAALDQAFERLTGGAELDPVTLEVQGRRLEVPRAAKGVARFSFNELCGQPLGPADYLAIEAAFHTVILDGVPQMTPALRNEAKRFVTLIDVLYEHRVHTIIAADAAPSDLYVEGTGAFEFARTASRLVEMQSEDYVETTHAP